MRAGARTTIDWNDDGRSAVKKDGVYFDGLRTPVTPATPAEKRRERPQGVVSTGGSGGNGGGDGGAQGGEVRDNDTGRTNISLYHHSVDSRVCQHVERFVKGIGRPVAEGRHLAQLLQVWQYDKINRPTH